MSSPADMVYDPSAKGWWLFIEQREITMIGGKPGTVRRELFNAKIDALDRKVNGRLRDARARVQDNNRRRYRGSRRIT